MEDMLFQVRRPSRYLGNEWNAVHKDPDAVALRFALAFPDTYEIGMSHLGFRILYHLINRREGVAAERFFCPWTDMEALLRQRKIPLCSQESKTPLAKFDLIGFSIPYEMGYSNVLQMLDLGGIPLKSEKRPEAFPLVIAGGPCTVNPEPIAPFFDAFLVGDGEEAVGEILDTAIRAKAEGWTKGELLRALAALEGIYVPSFFEVRYHPDGTLESIVPTLPGYDRVVRRVARGLDGLEFPAETIVPFMRVVHDRMSIEIARGCTKGCRFCQAGFIYRPVRERSVDEILALAERAMRATGYGELSLSSLSSGDYTRISDLLKDLMLRCSPERVAVSLPSLRVGSLSDDLMGMIKEVRKTGITVAPEAGTERLRQVINKDLDEREILETARRVFKQGWLSLKLYFMIGLPTETGDDLDGIVDLCRRIVREMGPKKARKRLSVSLSTFVPKPHTPFQWVRQLPVVETRERLRRLRRELKKIGVYVKWQNPQLSSLEGAFSRGDRRLAEVLLRAHELGCRFDGWSDQFRADLWERAFADCGIPLEPYATRQWSVETVLPWSHIDIGVSRAYLLEELSRAWIGQKTSDCREGACQGCSVCDTAGLRPVLAQARERRSPFPGMAAFQGVYHRARGVEIHRKFRVRYTKRGTARFLSHLELNNVVIRALRRGRIPLRFTRGYHPMPKIDFGPALAVGVESMEEYFDFESFGHLAAEEILEILRSQFPGGIEAMECREIPVDAPSLFAARSLIHFRVEIPPGTGPRGEELRERVGQFVRLRDETPGEREKREQVEGIEVSGPACLLMAVRTGPDSGVRLMELLASILGIQQDDARQLRICKTGVDFPFEARTTRVP